MQLQQCRSSALEHAHTNHIHENKVNLYVHTYSYIYTKTYSSLQETSLYHGAWADQRVLPWYNYNTPQWLVVIPWWLKV